MNLPTDELGIAIQLYTDLVDVTNLVNRSCEGILPDEYNYSEVISLLASFEMLVSDDEASRKVEMSFPPRFFLTMPIFLKNASRREAVPEEFYIAELGYRYTQDVEGHVNMPDIVKNYIQVSSLFQLLKEVCDFPLKTGTTHQLVFVNGIRNLNITSSYAETDIHYLDKFESFKAEFVLSEIHADQKHAIIKNMLLEFYDGEKEVNLSSVIMSFNEIYQQIVNNYQVYMSEFSFKKVKSEVEQDKLKYLSQLNKVFSDIQNQILSVPVALVLVASQMGSSDGWEVKNFSVWLGSLVFTVFLLFLIKNQKNTLVAVKNEIDQQWKNIQNNHSTVYPHFKGVYTQLVSRFRHQSRLLNTVLLMSIVAFLGTTALLLSFFDAFKLIKDDVDLLWKIAGSSFALFVIMLIIIWVKKID